jgi:hypothetical protein
MLRIPELDFADSLEAIKSAWKSGTFQDLSGDAVLRIAVVKEVYLTETGQDQKEIGHIIHSNTLIRVRPMIGNQIYSSEEFFCTYIDAQSPRAPEEGDIVLAIQFRDMPTNGLW